MRFHVVLPLLLLVGCALAQLPDCRLDAISPGAPINFTTRCNRTESCQICNRNDLSFDWLCCEDVFGWLVGTFYVGYLLQMYGRSTAFTLGGLFFFELFEHIYTSYFLNIFLEYESVMGSFIGDIMQGAAGFALASFAVFIFRIPPLIPSYTHANKQNRTGDRILIIFLAALHVLSVASLVWINSNWNWGLIVNMGVQGLWFLWVLPFFAYAGPRGNLVWLGDQYTTAGEFIPAEPVPIERRRAFFWITAAVFAGVGLTNIGWEFMANNWFQAWVVIGPLLLAAGLVSLFITARAKFWPLALQLASLILFILALSFYYTGGALVSNTWLYIAGGVFIAAMLAFFASEMMDMEKAGYKRQTDQEFVSSRLHDDF